MAFIKVDIEAIGDQSLRDLNSSTDEANPD